MIRETASRRGRRSRPYWRIGMKAGEIIFSRLWGRGVDAKSVVGVCVCVWFLVLGTDVGFV